jgi:hypothetical protein
MLALTAAKRDGYHPDRQRSHEACGAETLRKIQRVRDKLIGKVSGSPPFFCPTPGEHQKHQKQNQHD